MYSEYEEVQVDDNENDDNEESLGEYSEKIWGKEEGGEKITEGYSLKGKKVYLEKQ